MKRLILLFLLFASAALAQTSTNLNNVKISGNLTATNPGVYTNTQMNEYYQFLLDSCSPQTEMQAFQGGSAHATDAAAGCNAIPGSSAVQWGTGVSGYVNDSSTTTFGIGGLFQGRAAANGATVEGFAAIVGENAGISGDTLLNEINVNINGAPTQVTGFSVLTNVGASGTMPGNSNGLTVQCVAGSHGCWTNPFLISNQIAATASVTQTSGTSIWQSAYWTGSASAPDNLSFATVAGTGANPAFSYMWSHPLGTSGATLWGVQAPLVFTLFTTGSNAISFPLANPSGAASTITVPNGVTGNLPTELTATSSAFATATTAGTCVQNTTAVSGAATTMAVVVSPVSTPGVGAVWSAFVSSSNNVTINECAVATSAGGTIAFNIRVIQ